MNSVKNTLFSLLTIILLSSNLQASILLEPHFGVTALGTGTNSATEYSYNGTQYGMKLGYQELGIMVGVDYNLSSYTWERKTTSTTNNDKFDRTEIGAFAGYNFPILVRAWAGYYFSHTAKDQESAGATGNGQKYEGSATELGLGYTGLPFLSLNVVYRMISISKSINTSNISSSASISNSEIVLGISAPFTLL